MCLGLKKKKLHEKENQERENVLSGQNSETKPIHEGEFFFLTYLKQKGAVLGLRSL